MFEKIVFLGAGNVASVFAERLKDKNITVAQMWHRKEQIMEADLYIIAVPDDAIGEVVDMLPNDAKWVHTSANFDESRYTKHQFKGTLYLLQTFTKGVSISWDFPIFINSDNPEFATALIDLAKLISNKPESVTVCSKEQLKHLHVAAVFACNFTNHLWNISYDILQRNNLDFDILLPLISQTHNKISQLKPSLAQTGPAIRKDKKTMRKQMNLLSPWYRKLYKTLSKSIGIVKG